MVLGFLAVGNFDITRKIVKKIWGEKLWKFWGEKLLKFWGFVKIEFLDKNLTILEYHAFIAKSFL